MKKFLLQRLSSEPDKAAGAADGEPEEAGHGDGNPLGRPKRPGARAVGRSRAAAPAYVSEAYPAGAPPHAPCGGDKEQQTNKLLELYDEYKIEFKTKNFTKIEKIIVGIMGIHQDSCLLHIIHGEIFLFRGNPEKAHFHLSRYIESAAAVDDYALLVIATWNDYMDYRELALRQYTACLGGLFDTCTVTRTLFNLISLKKRLKFLDSSLAYLNRLLCVPEGYQLFPCIQLQIIHVHILKGNRGAAADAIRGLGRHMQCCFLRRLRAYLDYTGSNYDAVLRHRDRPVVDPYISYLIGRIGTEAPDTGVDVPHYFDEAIRNASASPFVYNSYGNYYFRIGRYSDAAVQYKNALSICPHFQPALDNMRLLARANDSIYVASAEARGGAAPAEADPDVEETGFLFVWSLLGYAQFRRDAAPLCPLSPVLPGGQLI